MSIKSIKYVIGIFVIFLLIGSLIWNYTYVMHVIETDKNNTAFYNEKYGLNQLEQVDSSQPVSYPPQQYMHDQESTEYKAISSIRSLHASSDFLLTGGKVDKYTLDNVEGWEALSKADILDVAQYERIISNFAVLPEIEKDMQNLIQLLNIAKTKQDLNALKYIHRILHDLDLFAFPEAGRLSIDYFGATHTAPSEIGKMLKEVESYISTNSVDVASTKKE